MPAGRTVGPASGAGGPNRRVPVAGRAGPTWRVLAPQLGGGCFSLKFARLAGPLRNGNALMQRLLFYRRLTRSSGCYRITTGFCDLLESRHEYWFSQLSNFATMSMMTQIDFICNLFDSADVDFSNKPLFHTLDRRPERIAGVKHKFEKRFVREMNPRHPRGSVRLVVGYNLLMTMYVLGSNQDHARPGGRVYTMG